MNIDQHPPVHPVAALSRRRFLMITGAAASLFLFPKIQKLSQDDWRTPWEAEPFSFDAAIETMRTYNKSGMEPPLPVILGCFVAFWSGRPVVRWPEAQEFFSIERLRVIAQGVIDRKAPAAVDEVMTQILRDCTNVSSGCHWKAAKGWLKCRILDLFEFPEDLGRWRTVYTLDWFRQLPWRTVPVKELV